MLLTIKLKSLIHLLFIIVFFLLGFFYTSEQVNASTYGGCSYGGGSYNHQCPTPTPISSSNSGSSNSGSSGDGSSVCTKQAPTSPPDLFQIDTTRTTAKLFFTPSQHPYTGYYVSFGDGKNSEGYGAEFSLSQSTGALEYDIYLLKPNTIYTFKVRAANDCKTGPWSNNLTIKTGANNTKTVNKYYPKSQASIGYLAISFNYIKNTVKNIAKPVEGNKQLVKPTNTPQEKTITNPPSAPQKSCFLWVFCW